MSKYNFNAILEKQSVNSRFENMLRYTDMVINKIQPSLLITGGAGTGKTFMIRQRLREAGLVNGETFYYAKGRASVAGLYVTLYENRDKVVVFDDCDSVFKDIDAINILKAALDSYDVREISYMSARPLKDVDGIPYPKQFEFTGQVIFISNLPESKIDDAVKSRSFVVDLNITQEQMLERMEDKLKEMEPEVGMKIKKEALEALKQASEKFAGVDLNMRSLIKAIKIRQMNFPNWQWMVAEQCVSDKSAGGTTTTKTKGRTKKVKLDKALAEKIQKGYNKGMNIADLAKKFKISRYNVKKVVK